MSYIIRKKCGDCKNILPLSFFYTRCDTGWYKSICKQCDKRDSLERQNIRYKIDAEFREASIVRSGAWGVNNKVKCKESVKKSRRKARLEVNLSYAKEVITKHSLLKISDIPDDLARAKQINIKLKREVRKNEQY